jgi:transcription initiation factor TFIIIB Brf1 subunit/transcription initiation factor TFIIB
MPIRCPQCGAEHSVAKFEGNRPVKCSCGFVLDLTLIQTVEDFLRFFESEEERKKALTLQREAQRICQMILDESCPEVDIEIAKGKLKEKVRQLFPDKVSTYEMIYESRFKRLWEQFRSPGQSFGK